MIGALLRIPAYKLMHAFGFPVVRPMNVTISTTFRCNSRCLTCNVYDRPHDELSTEEWEKVFRSLGRSVYWFTFSGGEPFLRKDLVEIVEAANRICRPRVINIPTNGSLGDRVVAGIERLTRSLGDTTLVVNVSLDAVGERNDVIRGLKDDYRKATETLRRLKALHAPNLTVGIHSVISCHNVGEFPAIADSLISLGPDQYIVEPAEERVELQTVGTGITPGPGEFDRAVSHVERRLTENRGDGLPAITRAIRLVYYRLARRMIREQVQVIPCYAGVSSAHVAANGDLWGCCTKAIPLGNLRDSDFDFDSIWRSDAARRERLSIKRKECACPLANAAYTSILCHAGSLVRVGRALLPGRRSGGVNESAREVEPE